MPLESVTNAPKSASLVTTPSTTSPTRSSSATVSHGSAESCLSPSVIFFSSGETASTTHSTLAPLLSTSLGWFSLRVHDRSEMWIRPSMPSSSSTNAP